MAENVPLYFPPTGQDAWETVDPRSLGWDPTKLEDLFTYAEEHNSAGLVVLYRGRILAERYWKGAGPHTAGDVASVQKSVTSFLTGIARQEKLVDVEATVSSYLGQGWSNAPPEAESRITLRHLLTMTSGLNDNLEFEADAGAAWYYNTAAYHLVKAVVERASGRTFAEYSAEKLFGPIGMSDSSWRERPAMPAPLGARARAAGEQAKPLAGLVASTRDLARFGLLMQAGGSWAGRALLSDRDYLKQSLSSSQQLNPSYGFLWWLNGKQSYVLPGRGRSGSGPLIPPAPADVFCALGAGDKKVYVASSIGLVVARHGESAAVARSEALSSFDSELWQRVMAAAPR